MISCGGEERGGEKGGAHRGLGKAEWAGSGVLMVRESRKTKVGANGSAARTPPLLSVEELRGYPSPNRHRDLRAKAVEKIVTKQQNNKSEWKNRMSFIPCARTQTHTGELPLQCRS